MVQINFQSFTGYVTSIEDFPSFGTNENAGCHKFISVQDETGATVNFIAGPETYFYHYERVFVGDKVTGYYDGDRPAILIYPPQYPALIMVKETPYEQVAVDYFNQYLTSSNGSLRLNLTPDTPISLTNNQIYTQNPANRNLIVAFGSATKSIPAQTTPYEIIVYCRND